MEDAADAANAVDQVAAADAVAAAVADALSKEDAAAEVAVIMATVAAVVDARSAERTIAVDVAAAEVAAAVKAIADVHSVDMTIAAVDAAAAAVADAHSVDMIIAAVDAAAAAVTHAAALPLVENATVANLDMAIVVVVVTARKLFLPHRHTATRPMVMAEAIAATVLEPSVPQLRLAQDILVRTNASLSRITVPQAQHVTVPDHTVAIQPIAMPAPHTEAMAPIATDPDMVAVKTTAEFRLQDMEREVTQVKATRTVARAEATAPPGTKDSNQATTDTLLLANLHTKDGELNK